MTVLNTLMAVAADVVDHVGYAGLAPVMLVENLLPIPSEVLLPVAGSQILSAQILVLASLAATLGSVLGSWMLYALGQFGGRPMMLRLPRFLGITEERLARTESWFARRGDVIVLLARLVPVARTIVSIPAGTLRMPLGRFLLFTAVGSLAWNAALIGLGMALATNSAAVLSIVSAMSGYLLSATVVGVVVLLVVRRARALGVRP